MLESDMDSHLGYNKYERSSDVDNYRNGTKSKRVRSKYGELDIDVPPIYNHLLDFQSKSIPRFQLGQLRFISIPV